MLRAVFVTCLLAIGASSPADACAINPPPFDPIGRRWDAIILGRVVNPVGTSGRVHADLAVVGVAVGDYRPNMHRVGWYVFDGRGMCAPASAPVRKGDLVSVYLTRLATGGYATAGWVVERRPRQGARRKR